MDIILKRNLIILAVFSTVTVAAAATYSSNKKNKDTSNETISEEYTASEVQEFEANDDIPNKNKDLIENKAEDSTTSVDDIQISVEIPDEMADLDFTEDQNIKDSWSNYSSDAKQYVSSIDNGLSDAQNYYLLQYIYEQSQLAGQTFNTFSEFMASDAIKEFNKSLSDSSKNTNPKESIKEAAKDYAKAYWDENGDRIKDEAKNAAKEAAKEYWDENGDEIKAEAKELGEEWLEEHKEEIIEAATDKVAEEAKEFLENNKDEIIKGIINQGFH